MQSIFADKKIQNTGSGSGICNVIVNAGVAAREQHNAPENYEDVKRQKKKLESERLPLVTQQQCSEVNADHPPSSPQLQLQDRCKLMCNSFKDHIYENLTFIENSYKYKFPVARLANSLSALSLEDNIYENICEKCDQIFSGQLCKNCENHKSGSTERKKRNFSDFFNSLKRRRKTEKKPPPRKIEIIHNVDGFEGIPFKANQTFDLQEICALKLQHTKSARGLNDPLPSINPSSSVEREEVIWRRQSPSDQPPAAADDERDDSWLVDRDVRLNSLTNIYENLFESLAIKSPQTITKPPPAAAGGEIDNKPGEAESIFTSVVDAPSVYGFPIRSSSGGDSKCCESPELYVADVTSDDITVRSEHNNSPEPPVIIITPSVATWMTSLEAETYDDELLDCGGDGATTRAAAISGTEAAGFFVKHIPSRTFDDRFYNNYSAVPWSTRGQQRAKEDHCKTLSSEICNNNRRLSCELDLNVRIDCFKSEVAKNLEQQQKVSGEGRSRINNTCAIVITVKDDVRYQDDDEDDKDRGTCEIIDNNANDVCEWKNSFAESSVTHTSYYCNTISAVKSTENNCEEERANPKNCNNSRAVLQTNDNNNCNHKCIPEGIPSPQPSHFRDLILATTTTSDSCRRILRRRRRRNAITETRNALTFQIKTHRLLSNSVRGIVLVIDPRLVLKGVLNENRGVLKQKRYRSQLRAVWPRHSDGLSSSQIVHLIMGVLSLVTDDSSLDLSVMEKPKNGENNLDDPSINSQLTDSSPDQISSSIIRHKDLADIQAYRGSREAIYQPIWKFHTVGIGRESSSSDTFDGSYNTNDFAEIGDAVEWEIAEEFEFGGSRETLLLEEEPQEVEKQEGVAAKEEEEENIYEDIIPQWRSDYQSVCILYDPTGNTANNLIIYHYDGKHLRHRNRRSQSNDQTTTTTKQQRLREEVLNNACESEKLLLAERYIFQQHPHQVPPSHNNSYAAVNCEAGSIMMTKGDEEAVVGGVSENQTMPPKVYLIPDSVTAWKFMLLDVHYAEDEEDVIMSVPNLLNISYDDAPVLLETKKLPSLQGPTKESKIQKTNLLNPRKYVMSGRLNIEDQKTSYLTKSTVGSYKQFEFGSVDNLNFLSKSKSASSILSSSPTKKSPRFLRFRPSSPREQDKQRTVVFGSDLSTLKLDTDTGVPKFVVECIRLIEEPDNIQTNGVYRASGNKNSIEMVRKRMNDRLNLRKDTIWQFLEKQDVHTLTGSLKLFFRSLSKPLIADSLFDQLPLELGDEDSLASIRAMIVAIDDEPKATLKYLIKHLTVVTDSQTENLMNSSNLSICWGACLFASSATAGNIIRKNHFVKLLIDHYHQIFEN